MKKYIILIALTATLQGRVTFESNPIILKKSKQIEMKNNKNENVTITLEKDSEGTVYITTNGLQKPAVALLTTGSAISDVEEIWFDGKHTAVYEKNDKLHAIYRVTAECRHTIPQSGVLIGAYFNPKARYNPITPILPMEEYAEYCYIMQPKGVKQFVGKPVPDILKR